MVEPTSLTRCPRCRTGRIYRDSDQYGEWSSCMQCGWAIDDGETIQPYDRSYERAENIRRGRTRHEAWKRGSP